MEGLFTGTANFIMVLLVLIVIGAALMLPVAALAYLSSIYKSLRRIEALLAARNPNDERDGER